MTDKNLVQVKKEIQVKGLDKIKEYFDLNTDDLTSLDTDALKHLYNMAKLGMQFEKEMNLATRASEMNFIRVGKMVMETKDELKAYIKRTLPQYS
jgi:hypothetical protein